MTVAAAKMTVLSLSGAIAAGGLTDGPAHGLLGAAGFVGAVVTLWLWVVKPVVRLVRNAEHVHKLLLGDGPDRPDLQTRLRQGDERMGRIESKVDDLGGRMEGVEGSLDVMAASERQDVRRALVAVDQRKERRRSGDL